MKQFSFFKNALIWVALLLAAGCASEKQFTRQDELLIRSIRYANKTGYESALSNGANVNACNSQNGMNPLLMAVIAGNPEYTRDLLKRGADINIQDLKGVAPLHVAAGKPDTELLSILLEYPVNLETPGPYGRTPLMEAARLGNLKAMELLIAKGADCNALDQMKRTPLMHAALAKKHSAEAVKLLLEKGADSELFDQDGMSAAMHAAAHKNTDAALFLLDKYPDFTEKRALGLSIMKQAIHGGDLQLVSELIKRKVPLNWNHSVALRETKRLQVHGTYRILVRNGVFDRRRTPLIWAAIENNLDMVKLLIDKGANPDFKDENGNSAYDLATDRDVISYLKKATKEYYEKLQQEKNQ